MTARTAAIPQPLAAETQADASTSRFVTAMLVAFVIHLIIILGVSFLFPETNPGRQATRSLEVIVLRQTSPSQETPESADAFAQVDHEGGGADEPQDTDIKSVAAPVPQTPEPAKETLRVDTLPAPITPPPPEPVPALEQQEPTIPADSPALVQPVPPTVLASSEPEFASDSEPQPPPPPQTPASEPRPPQVTATQILASRNLEIAELSARIQDSSLAYANRTRRKAISASTREYKYASYLEAWRSKVERVGNLNYPEEAKRHKMYGNLILHVAIRADGSIERVRVLRSSGFDLLDEAAVKIVELSAPFAPFPPDIRAETDVLDITRTWQFLSSNRLGWDN